MDIIQTNKKESSEKLWYKDYLSITDNNFNEVLCK